MKDALQKQLTGEVVDDPQTLKQYSTDWSLFSVRPKAVVYPKDTTDICSLVRYVGGNKKEMGDLSITPRSAGTDMTGGPLNDGIILDVTKYLNTFGQVERTNKYPSQTSFYGHTYEIAGLATVQPGMYYRDFEAKISAHNLLLPCYPASKNLCAVGGMVANNGAGEKTLKYGQNKDFVQSLEVVLSDGNQYTIKPLTYGELKDVIAEDTFRARVYKEIYELIRSNWELIEDRKPTTSKNASGYYLWDVLQAESIEAFEQGEGVFDMTKLFVGAQGTTGIITNITYKLVVEEQNSDLLVIYVQDMAVLPDLVSQLMEHDLEMLEMYDDHTFKIGLRFFWDFIKQKGFWGGITYAIRFIPEIWSAIVHGIPKLVILAEFVSNDEEQLHKEANAARASIKDLNVYSKVIEQDIAEEKFWDFRHDSFKILTEHSTKSRASGSGTRTAPFIDDIAIDPKHLPDYLPRLVAILDEHHLLYTIAGHLGNGNFHVIPLMDMHKAGAQDTVLSVSEKVYDLALQYDATITAEHNDGIIRTPYIKKMFGGEMMKLFEQVKDIFDPQNIFNPKKKVGGTVDDIKEHFAK